ncbi:MAG: prepilin-type N-terminal cleavage/methylation domain-containing protein [Candidatus Omnitrophota bacterium]
MRKSASPDRAGFTLLELIMVVTIMAVLAGAIVPNLNSYFSGNTIKNATSTLGYIIRFARSAAVERSVRTKISFNPENGDVIFSVEEDPSLQPGVYVPEPVPVAYPKEYKKEVKVAGIVKNSLFGSQAENELTFNPDGSTSDAFIYLADRDGRKNTIAIVGLTGQVMTWNYEATSFTD